MTKQGRTIYRLLLPLLFAVLLAAGMFLMLFSGSFSNADIAEDVLRFDLLSGGEKAARICAWNGNGKDFFLFLPSFAGLDAAVFAPLHASEITLDGRPVHSGDSLSSLESGKRYALRVAGNVAEDLTLTLMQASDIPALFITTSRRAMEKVHADKNHKEKAHLVLFSENGNMEYEGGGLDEIKGRGNSSWNLDKKPYHLNLTSAAPLLGMDGARHWVLLSNGWDRTGLRNKLVYDYAGKAGFPWTPESRYVDLYINGVYGGLYLLTEQAEFDAARISPADPKDSFLAEITQLRKLSENDPSFRTEGGRWFKITEPDKYSESRFSSICETIQKMEDALLSLTEDGP